MQNLETNTLEIVFLAQIIFEYRCWELEGRYVQCLRCYLRVCGCRTLRY